MNVSNYSNSLGQKVATPAMDKVSTSLETMLYNLITFQPIYDADDTPIAQSSLASQSDCKCIGKSSMC